MTVYYQSRICQVCYKLHFTKLFILRNNSAIPIKKELGYTPE